MCYLFYVYVLFYFFFFFKQKTAYEMRISDWSSDVCSSDLRHGELTLAEAIISPGSILVGTTASGLDLRERHGVNVLAVARQGQRLRQRLGKKLGRASGRERVCQYV